MVLHGVKECTNDIDLGCTKKLADELQQLGYKVTYSEDGSRKIQINSDFEIFEDWMEGRIEIVDSFPVVSKEGIILMKRQLNRDKDIKDIELIRNSVSKSAR